jgi:D-glycero-D-manno-heptose 1,7-bisphosphate phosphatase
MVRCGPNRAVFLDRDGVLVVPEFREGRSFAPTRLEDLRFYPDAAESVRRLKQAGFLLVVVSNQPDVGAGVIAPGVLGTMNHQLLERLPVDLIKVCTHTRADDCGCRKPRPGMLVEAAQELAIDCATSFMVGDRASDVAAGHAVGCCTVFIDLGYTTEAKPTDADHVVGSLGAATDIIIGSGAVERPRASTRL